MFASSAVSAATSSSLRLVTLALCFTGDTAIDEEEPEISRPTCAPRHLCSAISVAAIMRTADALSLANGPCSLTCADFFAEMEDQVHGLADDVGLDTPAVAFAAHPREGLAGLVRWPIAARPLEMSGDPAAVWRPRLPEGAATAQARPRSSTAAASSAAMKALQAPSLAHRSQRLSSVPARIPAATRQAEQPAAKRLERASTPGPQAQPQCPPKASAQGGDPSGLPPPELSCSAKGIEHARKSASQRERHRRGGSHRPERPYAGGGRAMPSGIGDLSMLLTGGGRMMTAGTGERRH